MDISPFRLDKTGRGNNCYAKKRANKRHAGTHILETMNTNGKTQTHAECTSVATLNLTAMLSEYILRSLNANLQLKTTSKQKVVARAIMRRELVIDSLLRERSEGK